MIFWGLGEGIRVSNLNEYKGRMAFLINDLSLNLFVFVSDGFCP